jgi:hypothetical protein
MNNIIVEHFPLMVRPVIKYTENFVITGYLKNGRRFKPIHTQTPQHYNIWKGSIWVIRKDNGKRKLVQRIWN